jgi:hypothetical protein
MIIYLLIGTWIGFFAARSRYRAMIKRLVELNKEIKLFKELENL